MKWYGRFHRDLPWRNTGDPYAIWVSEVMLQQTQVKTVLRYFSKFLNAFPDVRSLSRAELQHVLKEWEGLGYYARARHLHQASKRVIEEHQGQVPADPEDFSKLPGVGPYISAAVLSIAFDMPFAVIDGNVKRVLSRLFLMDMPVNSASSYPVYEATATRLLDPGNPGLFNQAVMELGALICKPKKPNCRICPLESRCKAFLFGKVAVYPKRMMKKKTPLYRIAIGIVVKKGRILITRRQSEGFLGGLWEFPGGKIRTNETPQSACVREIKEEVGLCVEIDRHLTRVKHAYSHFKIEADVFICRHLYGRVYRKSAEDHRWITVDEIDRYPFPGANRKFLPFLKDTLRPYDGKKPISTGRRIKD
ncbi:MAG: A/G-specific adenine glycosylase [Pseudomonadota bacterium]